MAIKQIGATLVLKSGEFFTNIQKAESATGNLRSKIGGATGGIQKIGSQTNQWGKGLASLTGKIVGVVGAYAGMRKIIDFGKECIKFTDGQNKAEARLEQLMKNVKGTTDAQIDSVKKYAAELQGLTTIGDEVAISGASQLATFQLQSDSIKKLMPAMENLAVGTYGVNVSQEQMIQSGNLIGKVMQGQIGALSRVGVTFSEQQGQILKTGTEAQKTATLIEVLNQNYGGLAEKMAQTPEGRVIQLKNAWGDVKEVIGAQLYPVVTNTLGMVANKIPAIQNIIMGAVSALRPAFSWFTQNALPWISAAIGGVIQSGCALYTAIKPALDKIFVSIRAVGGAMLNMIPKDGGGIISLASTTLPILINAISGVLNIAASVANFFSEHWSKIQPIIAGITGAVLVYKGVILAVSVASKAWAAMQAALNIAMNANPIGIIVVAVGALIGGIVALIKNWDKVKEKFPRAAAIVEASIAGIKVIITSCKDHIVAVFNVVKTVVMGVWNQIVLNVQFAIDSVKNIISFGIETVKTVFAGLVNHFKLVFDMFKKLLSGDFAGAWESAKAIVANAVDVVKNLWGNFVNLFRNQIGNIKQYWGDTWNNIKDTALKVWDKIVSGIKGFINKIIGGINGMINGINKVQINIPEGVPVIGGTKLGFNIPTIPLLAKGGTIIQGGSAIVGEKGPELLNLPRGASVHPLPSGKPLVGTNQTIYITINAGNMSPDEVADEMVRKLKFALANI